MAFCSIHSKRHPKVMGLEVSEKISVIYYDVPSSRVNVIQITTMVSTVNRVYRYKGV